MSDYKYIGWIPCLSGELFFSKTVPSLGSYDFFHANITCRDSETKFESRHLFVSSVVDWQDTEYLAKPNRGLYRAVVIAQSDTYQSLVGRVFLIEKNRLDQDKSFKQFFPRRNSEAEKKAIELIHCVENGGLHDYFEKEKVPGQEEPDMAAQSLNDMLAKAYIRINQFLSQAKVAEDGRPVPPFVHVSEFKIHKSGITLFDSVNSVDFASGKQSCRLSFYYLKFLLHKHSHHADDNESLTTLHDVRSMCRENSDILLRDIKRGLVDAKRSRRFSQHLVSGIATYGDSLVRSCIALDWYSGDKKFDGDNIDSDWVTDGRVQSGFLRNVRRSLDILQTGNKPERAQKRKNFIARLKYWLTTTIATVAPILIFANLRAINDKDGSFGKQVSSLPDMCGSFGYCRTVFELVRNAIGGDLVAFVSAYFAIIIVVPIILTLVFSISLRQFPVSALIDKGEAYFSVRAGTIGKVGWRKWCGALLLLPAFVIMQIRRLGNSVFRPTNHGVLGRLAKWVLGGFFTVSAMGIGFWLLSFFT